MLIFVYYDFVCISETKTHNIPTDEFQNFTVFTNEKNSRNVTLAILVNQKTSKKVSIIKNSESNCILWITVGSSSKPIEFILGAVYIPCQDSTYHDDYIFEEIESDLVSFNADYNVPIILMGDFNSRTGSLSDLLDLEQNIFEADYLDVESNISQKLESFGIPPNRSNLDQNTNQNGNSLIDLCQCLDLKIVNGRCGSDKGIGNFTFCGPRGSSLIDYCIVSTELLPCIKNFDVGQLDKCLSDAHCPISVSLNLTSQVQPASDFSPDRPEDYVEIKTNFTKRWIPENKSDFFTSFDENEITALNEHISSLNSEELDQNSLDSISNKLAKLFISTAQKVGMCRKFKKSKRKPRKHPNKPWWNSECESERKKYFNFKNSFKFTYDKKQREKDQEAITVEFGKYKKFFKKTKQVYLKNLHSTIRELKTDDCKKYWKILNPSNKKSHKPCNISIDILKTHFENLNKLHKSGGTTFDPRSIDHSINEQINKDFSVDEIQQIIKKLKNNKSGGIDNIIGLDIFCLV